MSNIETETQTFDPSAGSPFISEAGSASRLINVDRPSLTPPEPIESTQDTAPKTRVKLTPMQTVGLVAATGVLAASGGATAALAVESALNHSDPSVEQLQEQALDSVIITPSAENGDLISSAELGFDTLSNNFTVWNSETETHDPYPLNISHDRIVAESQEAQSEYLERTGQSVVPSGALFKMYLLEKEDGTFDVEINPETNNER